MIYWVSPEQIKTKLRTELPISRHDNSILSGDWDLNTGSFTEEVPFYNSFKERLAGKAWQETAYYQSNIAEIKSGKNKWGCASEQEFLERCQSLDSIYQRIKKYGFKQIDKHDFIAVAIGRDGDLLFCNGRHRLTFAKILQLKTVPIRIIARHKEWVDFCDQIHKYTQRHYGKIYAPIAHPEFDYTPAFHVGRSSYITDNILPSSETVLDIGSHWGYLPVQLERQGKKCIAVENSDEQLYFMQKLKKATSSSFEIISNDIFEYIGNGKKIDTVLALAIFHHFIKTKQLHEKLVRMLKALDMQEMFLLTHRPQEGQMSNAYANYGPEDFAQFIINNSCLDSYRELMDFKGRKLFHITKSINQDQYPYNTKEFSILLFAFCDTKDTEKMRKIEGQYAALRKHHPASKCIVVGNSNNDFSQNDYTFEFVDLLGFPDGDAERGRVAADVIKECAADIVYMPYPGADAHLEYLTRHISNIIFEYQDIGLAEIPENSPEYIDELAYGATCMQRTIGGVGVTDDITSYKRRQLGRSIPFRTISNGVDKTLLPLSASPQKNGKHHVLCMTDFRPSSGVDRLIASCAGRPEVASQFVFHLVGEGRALEEHKAMIQAGDLQSCFKFHGTLSGQQLLDLANKCCMGLGSLAPSRKPFEETNSITLREYALLGLPMVFAGTERDFPSKLPFCHIVPDDNNHLSMRSLLLFAQACKTLPTLRLHAREFALAELGWERSMETVVELAGQAIATQALKA